MDDAAHAVLRVNTFIQAQRDRFSHGRASEFAIAFSEIARYLGYLPIITNEVAPVAETFVSGVQRQLEEVQRERAESSGPINRPATDLEIEQLEEDSRIQQFIHLHVEAFYLFADIGLDRVGQAVEFYFGQGRACSLVKHSALKTNLSKFVTQKGLQAVPQPLLLMIQECQERVGDVRDRLIAHQRDARLTLTTAFTISTSEAWIAFGVVNPRPEEPSRTVEPPRAIMELVSAYVVAMIDWVEGNQDKARLGDRRAACQ